MFGFGEQQPVPCSDRALKLALAVRRVIDAQDELNAIRVPDYTAQWSPEDYRAEAQEKLYRAAESLERVIDGQVYEIGDFIEFKTDMFPVVTPIPFGTIVEDVTNDWISSYDDGRRYYTVQLLTDRGRDSGEKVTVRSTEVKGLSSRDKAVKFILAQEKA